MNPKGTVNNDLCQRVRVSNELLLVIYLCFYEYLSCISVNNRKNKLNLQSHQSFEVRRSMCKVCPPSGVVNLHIYHLK